MIFPTNEILRNYKDSDFGSIISSMQIETMFGNFLTMGDSDIVINIEPLISGEEGIVIFKNNCQKVLNLIDEALPLMYNKKFIEFYTWLKEDYNKNGVSMPFIGKII